MSLINRTATLRVVIDHHDPLLTNGFRFADSCREACRLADINAKLFPHATITIEHRVSERWVAQPQLTAVRPA